MPKSVTELKASIVNKSAKVGVIGLGYVGLPLIRAFMCRPAFARWASTSTRPRSSGCWPGKATSATFPPSGSPTASRPSKFTPTADMKRLAEADALLICVPTPLSESRDPDLTYVESHGPADRRRAAARPAGRAGKHDLSGHDPRRRAADPGEPAA